MNTITQRVVSHFNYSIHINYYNIEIIFLTKIGIEQIFNKLLLLILNFN